MIFLCYIINIFYLTDTNNNVIIKNKDITEKEPPKADAYILSYWNTDDVLDGMHFTAISKNNKGEYVFYNDDVRDEKETPVSTIKKRVDAEGNQPIIMLCISKNKER